MPTWTVHCLESMKKQQENAITVTTDSYVSLAIETNASDIPVTVFLQSALARQSLFLSKVNFAKEGYIVIDAFPS